MSGLLAVYAFDELWNLSNIVRYGLMALQHRGSQQYLICIPHNDVKCIDGENIEVSNSAIGHVVVAATFSDRNDSTFYVDSRNGKSVAVVAEKAWSKIYEFTQQLLNEMNKSSNSLEAFKSTISLFLQDSAEFIPSLHVLTNSREVIVWRSFYGLTPLVLGSYGFDMAIVSSESTAVDILGGDVRRFLDPGGGLYISRYLAKSFKLGKPFNQGLCLFELLYLARHDAVVDGVSVYEFRKLLGVELAKNLDKDVDLVVGVPETALPYAIGFAQRIGKPFELAFAATGGKRRSMLLGDPFEKIVAIHLKMNPVKSVLEGRRVALVDDSMVTGSTMKTISQILRFRVGVKELHIFIASPPLISVCPFNVVKLDVQNLLAANLSSELAKNYLEADSLYWLSKEDVDSVASRYGLKLCGRCFGIDFFGR
ncbi:MAG: amidophosphoribosyltransferase [Ignisphaera sp.]